MTTPAAPKKLEEPAFQLNQVVKIHTGTSDITGTVKGIHFSSNAEPSYNVRHYDSTGRVCDAWFPAGELVAA